MKTCYFVPLFILFLAFLSIGCSDRPEGFPAIVPCSITVTQGENPVEGVAVTFVPNQVMPSIIISGETDARGTCVPVTRFAGHLEKGVPPGEYAVVLEKEPKVEGPSPEERANMTYDQAMAASKKMEAARAAMPRIIPIEYTDKEKTPVKMSVSEGKDNNITVDIAKK